MVPNISIDNTHEILISEFEKLEKTIESLPKNSEIKIPNIVNLYYQTIMVQTLVKKLESFDVSSENSKNLISLDKINPIKIYVIENFSKSLHPRILSQLTNSIDKSTKNLKLLGNNSVPKTKETIEKEALLYKELRELMSTKEFVEQYDSGIKND